jgi:hypothetical protein
MAMGPATAGPDQEQGQANMDQAAESVEEIQGHPQDGRQHVYICHERGDHYVCHEVTERVE